MNKAININRQLILPAKHVGSFLLLIFLATFSPTSIWPSFPVSLEPITVLAIGLLLFYKIYTTIGFEAFYQKYKVELLLLTVYFSVCFLSLYLNRHRYADTPEIIRYGITFIMITASFPAAIFLFMLPQNESKLSLSRFKYSSYSPWIYFVLLTLMALFQGIDFESAKFAGQFFVTSEIWPTKDINGFFRVSTDLAPVLALLLICSTIYLFSIKNQSYLFCLLITFILAVVIAAIFTGARIFFLIVIISLTFNFFKLTRRNFVLVCSACVFLIILVHLLMYLAVMLGNNTLVYKLDSLFPYLKALNFGNFIFFGDFIPKIQTGFFNGRLELWQLAWSLINDNWLLGVSNGGFRFANNYLVSNTHNIFFQVLIDGGIIAFSIICLLIFRCSAYLKSVAVLPLAFSLLVDFQLDHSLPWNISVAYLVTIITIMTSRKVKYE